jgi:hypothetical protein
MKLINRFEKRVHSDKIVFSLRMHQGARVRYATLDELIDWLVLYAESDTAKPPKTRTFQLVRTGGEIPEGWAYVITPRVPSGAVEVYHLIEKAT